MVFGVDDRVDENEVSIVGDGFMLEDVEDWVGGSSIYRTYTSMITWIISICYYNTYIILITHI